MRCGCRCWTLLCASGYKNPQYTREGDLSPECPEIAQTQWKLVRRWWNHCGLCNGGLNSIRRPHTPFSPTGSPFSWFKEITSLMLPAETAGFSLQMLHSIANKLNQGAFETACLLPALEKEKFYKAVKQIWSTILSHWLCLDQRKRALNAQTCDSLQNSAKLLLPFDK